MMKLKFRKKKPNTIPIEKSEYFKNPHNYLIHKGIVDRPLIKEKHYVRIQD